MSNLTASIEDSNGNKAVITLETLDERVKKLETIKVKNGTIKEIPTAEVIAEIWEVTQSLRHLKIIMDIIHQYPRLIRFLKWFFSIAGLLQLFRWVIDYREWLYNLIK